MQDGVAGVTNPRRVLSPSPALAGEGRGEGHGNYDDPHPALRATFSRKSGRRDPAPAYLGPFSALATSPRYHAMYRFAFGSIGA